MSKVVETVQRMRKVEEATSSREEPAPVYLLDEILEIARSSAESAHGIAEHVVKRLAHKSPVVKFKALRLVKHMCSKGCPQFQRSLQRQPQAIRDLVHYKGEPDPFKGDAPNQHVRELAKETIEVLFNATAAPSASAAPQMQGRIQGFGSSVSPGSAAGTPSMPSFSPGSKMVGFGNTRTEQPLPPLGAPQSMSNMLGSMGAMLKSATSSISGPPGQHQARMFDSPPREAPPAAGASGHWAPTGGPYAAPAITAAQVMGSEEGLVGDLCAPGGMRAAPQQEDLDRFVAAVGSMDGLRVGELLREKMESSSWQTVLRALCALNAVVDKGSSQGCGEVAVMFQSDPTPVHQALQSPHAPVREAAARTMKLLLNEDVVVAAAAPKKYVNKSYLSSSRQQQQQQPAAPQPDLLGLSGSPSPRAAAPSPDLLGGFSSSPERTPPATSPLYTPPTPPQPQDTLFAGLETTGPTTPTSDQMFGGLHISEPPLSSPPARQQQQQQQQQQVDLLNLSTPAPSGGPPSEALDLLFAGAPSPTTHQAPYAPPARPLGAHPTPNLLGSTPDLLGGSASSSTSDLLGMQLPSPTPLAPHGMQPPQQMPGYPPPLAYGLQQPSVTQPAWAGAAGISAPAPGFSTAAYPQQQLPTGYMPDAGQYGGQYGGAGGMPGLQQQTLHAAAAAAALQNQMSGGVAGSRGGILGGGPMRQASWGGKDEVSNLMRHVASGGKHDPAFDFIKDELKPHK